MASKVIKKKLIFIVELLLVVFLSVGCNGSAAKNKDVITGVVTDIDGNEYRTIEINGKEWMRESLRVDHYNDGKSIPVMVEPSQMSRTGCVGRFYYKGDEKKLNDTNAMVRRKEEVLVKTINSIRYYNFSAVETGRLCPKGWHVPSLEEWIIFKSDVNQFFKQYNFVKETLRREIMETGYQGCLKEGGTKCVGSGSKGLYWTSTDAGSDDEGVKWVDEFVDESEAPDGIRKWLSSDGGAWYARIIGKIHSSTNGCLGKDTILTGTTFKDDMLAVRCVRDVGKNK